MKKLIKKALRPIYERLVRSVTARVGPKADSIPANDGLQQAIDWNIKLYGSQLARKMFDENLAPLLANEVNKPPATVPLTSKLCEEADIETAWFVYWCRQLQIAPIYHRKVWEDCFALQAMHEANLLRPGVAAISFGTGEEPLPSFLASLGVDVLATDLAPQEAKGTGWIETNQHSSLDKLHKSWLVDRATFEQRVRLRYVDMNAIPSDLHNKYDIVWSICSLEHVGTTALACRFIKESVRCLRPGGMAVHTTEFNLSSETETVTSGPCILFTRPQLNDLCADLRNEGYAVSEISFDPGSRPLDQYVDIPPFPTATLEWKSSNLMSLPVAPHLRLALMGYVSTSVALIIRRMM